jgi:hypothetical protein
MPTLVLPADINARIAAVKRDFDAEVRARLFRRRPGRGGLTSWKRYGCPQHL